MVQQVEAVPYLQAAVQSDAQVSLRLIPQDFTVALLPTLGEKLR